MSRVDEFRRRGEDDSDMIERHYRCVCGKIITIKYYENEDRLISLTCEDCGGRATDFLVTDPRILG